MNVFSLDGETAIITGGGTGLGYAMAHCFIESGARVVITGRRKEIIDESANKLGTNAYAVQGDVTDYENIDRLLETARESTGSPISILVNNAGNLIKKPTADISAEEFASVLNTHVVGAHAMTRAVIPEMKEHGHGHILFIASMGAIIGLPQVATYCAAKSAYGGLTRSLASELSPDGIRVNAIAPGWIETEMVKKALARDQERRERILERTPMGSFGQPEDVGWAATYLSSPAAKFVTGAMLRVDGGVSIGL